MKKKNMFFGLFVLLLSACLCGAEIFSTCPLQRADAAGSELEEIKGYDGSFDHVYFGSYPQSKIGDFDASASDPTVASISSMIDSLRTENGLPSLSGGDVDASTFFLPSDASNEHISFDSKSKYYTLKTSAGTDYPAGTQIYTYSMVYDCYEKYNIDASTKISDITFKYRYGSTDKTNDGKIGLFKVEPISWKVLRNENGLLTLMSDKIIDSHNWAASGSTFSNEYWQESSINSFLNSREEERFSYEVSGDDKLSQTFTYLDNYKYYQYSTKKMPEDQDVYIYTVSFETTEESTIAVSYIFQTGDSTASNRITFSYLDKELENDFVNDESFDEDRNSFQSYGYYKQGILSYEKVPAGEHFFQIKLKKLSGHGSEFSFYIYSPIFVAVYGDSAFTNKAFTDEEYSALEEATNDNYGSAWPGNSSLSGNKVWLLSDYGNAGGDLSSISGFDGIKNNSSYRVASRTAYSIETGNERNTYWLSSKGYNASSSFVDANGELVQSSQYVTRGILPVIMVRSDAEGLAHVVDSDSKILNFGELKSLESNANVNLTQNSSVQSVSTFKLYTRGEISSIASTASIEFSQGEIASGKIPYAIAYSNMPLGGFFVVHYSDLKNNKNNMQSISTVLASSDGTLDISISSNVGACVELYYILGNKVYSCDEVADYDTLSREILYVNNNTGNDYNSGTSEFPLKNIQTAMDRIVDGGTIISYSSISASNMKRKDDLNYYFNGRNKLVTLKYIGGERLFDLSSSTNVTLDNLILDACSISVNFGQGFRLTLDNVTIKNVDTSSNGGGIIVSGGDLSVLNCSFLSNQTLGNGGVIYLDNQNSNLWLESSIFTDNKATNGGAIYVNKFRAPTDATSGCFISSGNVFDHNSTTQDGGAIYVAVTEDLSHSLTLRLGNTFTNNTAERNGGAIYSACSIVVLYSEYSPLSLPQTLFKENEAQNGGAIYCKGSYGLTTGTLNLNFSPSSQYSGGYAYCDYRTTFDANSATSKGMAIYFDFSVRLNRYLYRTLMSSTFKNHVYSGSEDVGVVYVDEKGYLYASYLYIAYCDFCNNHSTLDDKKTLSGNAGLSIVDSASGGKSTLFYIYYSKFHDSEGGTIIDVNSKNDYTTHFYLYGSIETSRAERFGYDGCNAVVSDNKVSDSIIKMVATKFLYFEAWHFYVERNTSNRDIIYYSISDNGAGECFNLASNNNYNQYIRYNEALDNILDINGGANLKVRLNTKTQIEYNVSGSETIIINGSSKSEITLRGTCSYNVVENGGYVQKITLNESNSTIDSNQTLENNIIQSAHNAMVYIKAGDKIGCGSIINGYGSLCGGAYIESDVASLTVSGSFTNCTYTGENGVSAIYLKNTNADITYSYNFVTGHSVFESCNRGFESFSFDINGETYTCSSVAGKSEDHVSISNYDLSNQIKFEGCKFINNLSNANGGVLYIGDFDNISISNCSFEGNESKGNGGALYIAKEITISGCDFKNNKAQNGGAIYAIQPLTISEQGHQISGNEANSDGGFIYSEADINISGSADIYYNKALTGNGGAIFVDNNRTLNITGINSGVRFYGNKAENGNGGAIFGAKDLNCENLRLGYWTSGAGDDRYINKAKNGGGIYTTGKVILTNSTNAFSDYCFISYNGSVKNGGAIYISGAGDLSIDRYYITSNVSDEGNGGAIYFNSTGNFSVKNSFVGAIDKGKIYSPKANYGGAFYFENFGTAIVENTNFKYCQNAQAGGVIYSNVVNNTLELVSNTLSSFEDCKAVRGGAIYSLGDLSIKDYTFKSCIATIKGGAIYSSGELNIQGDVFDACSAKGSDDSLTSQNQGGAIYFSSESKDFVVSGCQFNSCDAYSGGAIYADKANSFELSFDEHYENKFFDCQAYFGGGVFANTSLKVSGYTFDSCHTSDFSNENQSGGGIYFYSSNENLTIENVSFKDCLAYSGGCVYSKTSSSILIGGNTVVESNKAQYGAFLTTSGSVSISDSSFDKNIAYFGGTIVHFDVDGISPSAPVPSLTISNSEIKNSNIVDYQGHYDAPALFSTSNINNFTKSRKFNQTFKNVRFIGNSAMPYYGETSYNAPIVIENNVVAKFNNCSFENNFNSSGVYSIEEDDSFNFTPNENYSKGGSIRILAGGVVNMTSCNIYGQTQYNFENSNGEIFIRDFAGAQKGSSIYVEEGGTLLIDGGQITQKSDSQSVPNGILFAEKGAKISLYNTLIKENNTTNGVIVFNGELTLKDCVFDSNTTSSAIGSDIYVSDDAVANVYNCNFYSKNPSSSTNRAIYVKNGRLVIVSSEIYNKGAMNGGAIYIGDGATANLSRLNVHDCRANNGIIFISKGSIATIDNSNIFNSSYFADGSFNGVALYNEGSLTIHSTEISNIILPNMSSSTCKGKAIYSKDSSNLILDGVSINSSINGAKFDIYSKSYAVYIEGCADVEVSGLELVSNVGGGIDFVSSNISIMDSKIQGTYDQCVINVKDGNVSINNSDFASLASSDLILNVIKTSMATTSFEMANCNFKNNELSSSLMNIQSTKLSIRYSTFEENTSSANKDFVNISGSSLNISHCKFDNFGKALSASEIDNSLLGILKIEGSDLTSVVLSDVSFTENEVFCPLIIETDAVNSKIYLSDLVIKENSTSSLCSAVYLKTSSIIQVENSLDIENNITTYSSGGALYLDGNSKITLANNAKVIVSNNSSNAILSGEENYFKLNGKLNGQSEIRVLANEGRTSPIALPESEFSSLSHEDVNFFKSDENKKYLILSGKNIELVTCDNTQPVVLTNDIVYTAKIEGKTNKAYTLPDSENNNIKYSGFIVYTNFEYECIEFYYDEDWHKEPQMFSKVNKNGYDIIYRLVNGERYLDKDDLGNDLCVKLYILPQILHIEVAPTISVSLGAPLSSAKFVNFNVVDDDNMSVAGTWEFVNSSSTSTVILPSNANDLFEVKFVPYNSLLYEDENLTVFASINATYNVVYYKNGIFYTSESFTTYALNDDSKIADIMPYLSNNGKVVFLSTYAVEDSEAIVSNKTIYFVRACDIIIENKETANLSISGGNGKIIIDGFESGSISSAEDYVVQNYGYLIFGNNVFVRNFENTSNSISGIIYNAETGTLLLDGCEISGCSSSGNGGAIYNLGVFIENAGDFHHNSSSGNGGFIYSEGEVTLNGGSIRLNTSQNGGGIYSSNGVIYLNTGEVKYNTASKIGGGIYAGENVSIVRSGSKVYGNSASQYPQIYCKEENIIDVVIFDKTTYSITFMSNEGILVQSGSALLDDNNTFTASYNKSYKISNYVSSITKTGYEFTGWLVTSGLNETTAKAGATNGSLEKVTTETLIQNNYYIKNLNASGGAVTLTAQWRVTKYKVKFDINGENVSFESSGLDENFSFELEYDQSRRISAHVTSISRVGYTFNGWVVSSMLNTETARYGLIANSLTTLTNKTLIQNNHYIKNLNASGAEVTLTAQWTEHKYTVTFNDGEATTFETKNLISGSFTATYDEVYRINTYITKIEKTGYTFKGWNVTNNLDPTTALYGSNNPPTGKLTSSAIDVSSGDYIKNLNPEHNTKVNLTAHWEANAYTITFQFNGATAVTVNNLDGNSFVATYDEAYKIDSYVTGISKTGYEFKGWSVNGFDTTAKYGESTDPQDQITTTTIIPINYYIKNLSATKRDITISAEWTANKYKIKFDSNDAEIFNTEQLDANNSFEATYDTPYLIDTYIKDISKTGYTFDGFRISVGDGLNTGTSLYGASNNPIIPLTEMTDIKLQHYIKNLNPENGAVVTLKAHWTENTYTITFDSNGATTFETQGLVNNSFDIGYDEICQLNGKVTLIEKEGYRFRGWKLDPNLDMTTGLYGENPDNMSEIDIDNFILNFYYIARLSATGEKVTLIAYWVINKATISLEEDIDGVVVYYSTDPNAIRNDLGSCPELTTTGFTANANITYYFRALTTNVNGYTVTFGSWSGWFNDTNNPSEGHSFTDSENKKISVEVETAPITHNVNVYVYYENENGVYYKGNNGGTINRSTTGSIEYDPTGCYYMITGVYDAYVRNTTIYATASGIWSNGVTTWYKGTNDTGLRVGTGGSCKFEVTSDMNVACYFARNTYQLTLTNGTGVNSTNGSGFYRYGEFVDISASINESAYTFAGWSVVSGDTPVSIGAMNTQIQITQETKLKAICSPRTFSINYELNGGIHIVDTKIESYTYSTSSQDIEIGLATKEGHDITSGYPSASSGSISGHTLKIGSGTYGNIVVTWEWTIKKFSLIINNGPGIISTSGSGTYNWGSTVPISASMRSEATFDEWYVSYGNTPISTSSKSTQIVITQNTYLMPFANYDTYTIPDSYKIVFTSIEVPLYEDIFCTKEVEISKCYTQNTFYSLTEPNCNYVALYNNKYYPTYCDDTYDGGRYVYITTLGGVSKDNIDALQSYILLFNERILSSTYLVDSNKPLYYRDVSGGSWSTDWLLGDTSSKPAYAPYTGRIGDDYPTIETETGGVVFTSIDSGTLYSDRACLIPVVINQKYSQNTFYYLGSKPTGSYVYKNGEQDSHELEGYHEYWEYYDSPGSMTKAEIIRYSSFIATLYDNGTYILSSTIMRHTSYYYYTKTTFSGITAPDRADDIYDDYWGAKVHNLGLPTAQIPALKSF